MILCVFSSLSVAMAATGSNPLDLVFFQKSIPAPAFRLPVFGGKTLGLEDLRGRYVLLNFWATWCPPCVKEMPSMQRLQDALPSDRFQVVAISSDTRGARAVAPFVKRLGIHFPVLLDRDGAIAGRYGARELPTTFLIGPRGEVVAAARGARAWASPQATAALRALVAPTRRS